MDEPFIVHSVTLYTDTGVPYASDYFNVLVYGPATSPHYKLDERLSKYFGAGGDILTSLSNNDLAYEFPSKSELVIRNQLESAHYLQWLNHKKSNATIREKTYLHDQPNTSDTIREYLIKGDRVEVLDQQAGWLFVNFRNPKKGDIQSWVKCRDTDYCHR